jgi:hypothetical protein
MKSTENGSVKQVVWGISILFVVFFGSLFALEVCVKVDPLPPDTVTKTVAVTNQVANTNGLDEVVHRNTASGYQGGRVMVIADLSSALNLAKRKSSEADRRARNGEGDDAFNFKTEEVFSSSSTNQ